MQEPIIEYGLTRPTLRRFRKILVEAISEGASLQWPPLMERGFLGLFVTCTAVLNFPDPDPEPNEASAAAW